MSSIIDAASTGTFEVHTAAGTDYVIELGDVSYITRKPGMSRPQPDAAEPTRLPYDFECVTLHELPRIVVGEPFVFLREEDDGFARVETAVVTAIHAV